MWQKDIINGKGKVYWNDYWEKYKKDYEMDYIPINEEDIFNIDNENQGWVVNIDERELPLWIV